MDTKVIPLSEFQADPAERLLRCFDSGVPFVVELPNRGRVAIHPVDAEDDLIDRLIEQDEGFRDKLTRSLAGPREPFPFTAPGGPDRL